MVNAIRLYFFFKMQKWKISLKWRSVCLRGCSKGGNFWDEIYKNVIYKKPGGKKWQQKNRTAKKRAEEIVILWSWNQGAVAGLINFWTRSLISPAKMRNSRCKTRNEISDKERGEEEFLTLTQIIPCIPRRACVTELRSVSSPSFVVMVLLVVAV